MNIYMVLIIYNNEIIDRETFDSFFDAENRAVQLGNEYYRKDGIEEFGKYRLGSFDEMKDYYGSDAYLDSGDGVHVCIEKLMGVMGV